MSIFTQHGRVVTSWPTQAPAVAPTEEVTVIRTPIYEPPPPSPAPRIGAAVVHTSTTIAAAHDARLLAILDQDLSHAPAAIAFSMKEKQLGDAFAALPVFDQRALHTRLSSVRSGDLLAERFNRLAPERRTRLLNFLGDARRRAAQAATGKR